MPARIAELTEGQRGRMAAWAQEWVTRGLATGPVDRGAVEEAIEARYRLAGLRWPGRVVWVPSPVVGALAAPLAAHPLFNEFSVREAEAEAWVDGVHRPVRGSLAGVLSDALHLRVRGAVSAAISAPVHRAVMDGVHEAVQRGLIEWWWPHRRFVLVCERPAELHLEWAGPGGVLRLHDPDGPAIRWRDGWAVHALHGTRLPAPDA